MLFSLEKNKQQIITLSLLAGWSAMLLLSILLTPLSILLKGTVLISILTRGALLYFNWLIFSHLFGSKELNSSTYEKILMYTGYAIVFTYVCSMLPEVVSEYYQLNLWKDTAFYVIWVICTTAFPAALWVWLNRDKNRLAMGAYDKKELVKRSELEKDKKKKKLEQKKLHDKRGPIKNLWVEWIEPLFGAVLWVLLINHFVLQLYQIPSESMVPTFLIKDRVLVGKTFYAPNIPLTKYKLPRIAKPKEGEVIIFTNPKVEDPDSEYYYKNVMARVFHTFVYMITFTTLDIDSKQDGSPKERLLVKRNIAGPGEKICVVNDQVYKKREGEDWVLMSDIAGQQEYGRVEQYSSDNRQLMSQKETPEIRRLVEEAQSLVESYNPDELETMLIESKMHFIEAMNRMDLDEIEAFEDAYYTKRSDMDSQYTETLIDSYAMMSINSNYSLGLSDSQKRAGIQNFSSDLEAYDTFLLNLEIRNFILYLSKERSNPGYFDRQISTELHLNPQDSPYQDFMARLNGLYKIRKMEFFTALLENDLNLTDSLYKESYSQDLYRLVFFVDGFGAFQNFDMANFPEFPEAPNQYMEEDEYFLMGDNRYNSLDSRMGTVPMMINVDSRDTSDFALQAQVHWDAHTIPLGLIHGKVRFILFPLGRMHFFK